MLFPYHLADMIVKGLRITPFNYYISVVEKLMQAERSYDTLPNFTAADCKFLHYSLCNTNCIDDDLCRFKAIRHRS